MTTTHSRVNVCPRARARALRSEDGSILMLTALSMVVLLSMVALAVDGSYMYTERNRMAAAADAGARAGAQEYRRNPASDLQAFANREVVRHGFDPAVDTTVTVHRPPQSGSYTGSQNYVEVIVSRPTASFFATIMSNVWATLTPGARAVAGTSSAPNCLITLNQSGNPSLAIAGTVNLNMGCGIQANGNMTVGSGSGSITASGIGVQGTCSGCPGGTTTGVPPAPDPLQTLAVPSNPYGSPNPVVLLPSGPASITIAPGWYSKIDIANNKTVTFSGNGLYWITGPILIGNQAIITGNNLMFYLDGVAPPGPCLATSTAGCINIPNGATVQLQAPTSGAYEGILMFQARTNALDATFNNAGSYDLSGAMYFPAATVSYGNAGASNDCTLFVANNINLGSGGGGSMNFTNTCSAFPGGSPILTVTLAE